MTSLPPSFLGPHDAGPRQKAGGLDVLSQNSGEMARRLYARDLAANLVTAIFRVVKLSTLHSIDNQAMVRQVDDTVAIVNDYCQHTEHNVSVLFAHGSVFVGGLLLRANRAVYEGALELGEILEKVGAAEIGIQRDVCPSDFFDLATALAEALRSAKPKRLDRPSPRIRLRGLNATVLGREGTVEQRLAPAAQVARTYATAVVIMRRFFEGLRRGKYELPQRVKRVAQRLVDLSAGETPAFLGVTAARNANHDEAGRAINTAILSLSMTRQITADPVMLSRVAMAALLYDAARPRLAGVVGQDPATVMPQLSEQQENDSPAGTAVVLTALGRVNEPSVMRTVIAYEAHWVKRRASLGALYRGLRQPSMQARIIAVARAFNDRLTPAPGVTPPSADEAVACLEKDAAEPADRTALRLLVGALGLFPTGTLVELSTGEMAVVVATPVHPSLYSQPRVRVVLDAAGGALPRPIEIDLAQQRLRPGDSPRDIRRVAATSDDAAAASLRAQASGPIASIEPSTKGVPGASGIRAQGAAPPTMPPPSSVNPSLSQAPSSRLPTLASQFTRRDASSPPAARSLDLELQRLSSPETEWDARIHDEPSQGGTREVSWDEQAGLLEAKRTLVEDDDSAPSDPFSAEQRRASTESEPLNAPTAEGTLARTPFVHLLIYMLDQRLTGTTVFRAPNGVTHSIYFEDGAAAKIRTGVMVAPLDRVLVEQGLLDEATLRNTLMEVSKQRVLHGRYLVMRGLIDREMVIAALRVQLLRKVTHLFELPPETRYAYYEGENLLASYGGPELTPCEPLAVIMSGIRLRASDPLVDATLLRIAARPLALHIDAELRRFHLQRDERSVVDLIRARRMALSEVLGAGVAQERVVRLTIYALALTRHLDLGSGRTPVGIHREWPGIGVLDLGQGVSRESSSVSAPQPHSAGAPAPSPRSDSGSPAMQQPPDEPVQRQTTRLPQVDPLGRQTTRMPRTTGTLPEAEARRPHAATPAQVLRTPGWRSSSTRTPPGRQRLDPAPVTPSRPTTKLPRVAIPPEAYDTAEDSAPSSRSSAAAPNGPPSSRNAPLSSRSSSSSAVKPSPPAATSSPSLAPSPPPAPSPSKPASDAPLARSQEHAARRAEIERRSQSIDSEDYFQMLGIARDATSEQIRGAYFSLARGWHPDRLPGELADMKAPLGRVFARFNDAYQTLSDVSKRKEYLGRLQQGEGTAEDDAKLARVVDAALEFQKAEILLKKNDLAGAEALASRAAEADPEQPEYVALLMWIRALRRGDPPGMQEGTTSPHFDDLIQILDQVIAKEPRYERALYYRGVLQKRAGRIDKAIRDFKLVAEINPKNLDAVREVRLHEMRRRTSPTASPPEGSGLFGKFFKR